MSILNSENLCFLWGMTKQADYTAVRVLIETGNITVFRGIFDHASRTTIAKDMGIYYTKFKRLIDHVDGFTIKEIYQLSRIIGVEGEVIVQLVVEQLKQDRLKRKKPK